MVDAIDAERASTCPVCGANMLLDDGDLVFVRNAIRWRHVTCPTPPALPTLRALYGIAPDLTGGVGAVEFVRHQRDREGIE